jgi:hypothetical protein
MGKITKHQLEDDYREFWTRFKQHCMRNHLPYSPPSELPFSVTEKDSNLFQVEISPPIYLPGWPEDGEREANTPSDGAGSVPPKGAKVIDILIYGSETVDMQTGKMRWSEIHAEYYSVQSTKAVTAYPRELIRYDFKAPQRPAHPVFHAQRTAFPCCGDETILQKNSHIKWEKVETKGGWTPVGALKIPTAHMCAVSVLVSVCADHNSRAAFGVFFKELLTNRHKAPCADAVAMDKHALRTWKSWESLAWYPMQDGVALHSRAGHSRSLRKSA